MSDKKTLHINPELFKVSGGKTRKKKDPSSGPVEIKPRIPKNKSIRKSLTNLIRARQEQLLKKNATSVPEAKKTSEEKFNDEFDESLKYLNSVVETSAKKNQHNHTLKQSRPIAPTTMVYPHENVSLAFPTETYEPVLPRMSFPSPTYGCLKGGSLPTYRQWTKTQKVYSAPAPAPAPISFSQPPAIKPLSYEQEKKEITKQTIFQKMERQKTQPQLKHKKQKKIIRRTFKLGKSKVHPKISVLISNKTVRNNITTQTQLLQQTPMSDIKKYLVKHGFIKVGTIAPNDVLRKMYESAVLICGDIQNHNNENLLYNYFNDK